MNVKRTDLPSPPDFTPFRLEIDVETLEEAAELDWLFSGIPGEVLKHIDVAKITSAIDVDVVGWHTKHSDLADRMVYHGWCKEGGK